MKKSTTIVLSLFFLVLVFVTVQGEEENVDEVLFSDDDVFDYNLFSKRGFKHPFARFLRSSPLDDDGQVPVPTPRVVVPLRPVLEGDTADDQRNQDQQQG